MPNRGQTQDQGQRGRNPGTFSPDDDTAQNEDNQRQAQEQEEQREARSDRRDFPAEEGADIDSDDDAELDDDEVTGVSQ